MVMPLETGGCEMTDPKLEKGIRINMTVGEWMEINATATRRLELLSECREIMMLLPAAIFDQIPNDLWARLAKELDDD
jgi:hypothetical protein